MLAARVNNPRLAATSASSSSSSRLMMLRPASPRASLAQRRALPLEVLSGLAAAGDVDAPIGVVIGG